MTGHVFRFVRVIFAFLIAHSLNSFTSCFVRHLAVLVTHRMIATFVAVIFGALCGSRPDLFDQIRAFILGLHLFIILVNLLNVSQTTTCIVALSSSELTQHF